MSACGRTVVNVLAGNTAVHDEVVVDAAVFAGSAVTQVSSNSVSTSQTNAPTSATTVTVDTSKYAEQGTIASMSTWMNPCAGTRSERQNEIRSPRRVPSTRVRSDGRVEVVDYATIKQIQVVSKQSREC